MKAPKFKYARAETVEEALTILGAHGDDARILAGGQSLMPMLALRVARPEVLVDLNPVSDLDAIRFGQDGIYVGALTRYSTAESSDEIRKWLPLLSMALPHVGHPAIRNRGTFGGSCALADPAAEIPACALALGATFVIGGRFGQREVPASDFFLGLYSTALRPGEILLGAHFPLPSVEACSGFAELAYRHGDYAIVGIAAHGRMSGGNLSDLRLVYFGCGDQPILATAAARALNGQQANSKSIDEAIDALRTELDPRSDLRASAAMRMHLAGVLTRRVLSDMTGISG